MLPCLPGHDPAPSQRAGHLEKARAHLRYAWDQPPGIAMAAEVPHGEGYSLGVVAKGVALEVVTKANRAASHLAPSHDDALASYRALFATIEAPALASVDPGSERADAAFAWQRVGGANPFLLEGVDRLPDSFPVSERDFAAAVSAHDGGRSPAGGDSLAAALAEGRAYLASYGLLAGIPTGQGAGAPKYLEAPVALFVAGKGTHEGLRPVAIQCALEPGPLAPILTPRDGASWQMARAVVQIADCNLHELFFHLGRAHFLVEAFVVAAGRQLAPAHPLAVLLAPHFEGTLAINDGARTRLCAAGGQVETLLAPTREASLALCRRAIETFRLEDALLPADLRRRRVDDPRRLGDYPYRDDALLVWSALSTFVGDYLALYYPDDAAVASDTELRAWTEEIHGDDGGRVRGFPARIETLAELTSAVTWLVFTTSAQHAAVNYSQFEMMGYAPNMPAAGYAPAREVTARDPSLDARALWARLLPPLSLAAEQLDFFYQQSMIRQNELGRYAPGHFTDPRVEPLVARFTRELAAAEDTIAARNRSRFMPYPWLLPSRISASIHI